MLDRLLSAEGALQPVLAKAREIRTLAELVGGFLPADLARLACVTNFREGELVLQAATPAVAAKLRLLAPSLCRFLSSQRWQVISVSLRVQPNSSRAAAAFRHKNAQFSTPALASLKELYLRMEASPAREALGAMLARRGAIDAAEALRLRRSAKEAPARKPRT